MTKARTKSYPTHHGDQSIKTFSLNIQFLFVCIFVNEKCPTIECPYNFDIGSNVFEVDTNESTNE
jgi:hypothetical protein